VAAGSGPSADTTLIVREDAAQASAAGSLDGIPALSGGVTVSADRLDPLVAHLEGLPRPAASAVTYPLRSPWWMMPFAVALSVEWLLRRRQALR
jgi:hypothetical protein